MEAGIVGLPNVGKSTLYNALTGGGAEASNYPFCTIEPNTGIVAVPDRRLQIIQEHINSEKIIPAAMKVVDIAGIVKGASEGEGLGNKFLTHIREVDAILHVVRCFEDLNINHVDGSVDPLRDIETIETELMLADLQVVENSLSKAKKMAKGRDKEAEARVALLESCLAVLSEGRPIRALNIEDEEQQNLLRAYGMLSAKRILYVTNVDEEGLTEDNEWVQQVRSYTEANGGEVVKVCAKIEEELAELDPEDRNEMLESLGLEEPALDVVIRATYHLLGLQSYFTAGPKEIRAWTIPVDTKAPQAAGVIHSDFESGFIRAEAYSVDDLIELKDEAAIRSAGRMRVEGKEYVVHDSDILHFLHNG
jgi:GTP-binding protein YchF